MGSSGLIVAFAVAVWAAYFVPLVLRRYDEAGKSAALEQESPRSRKVSTTSNELSVRAETVKKVPEPKPERKPRITTKAARVAARRRRRTFLTLIVITLVATVLTAVGQTPWWTPTIGAGLIIAWLVACRIQVRYEQGISTTRRERAAAKAHAAASVEAGEPELLDGSQTKASVRAKAALRTAWSRARPIVTLQFLRASRQVPADFEETIIIDLEDIEPDREHVMEDVPLDSNSLDEKLQIAVPSVTQSGEAMWDPLPVTLPTYVTKPRAGRTVRTIDFTKPGAWTSGHIEGQDVDFPAPAGRADDDGQQQHAVGH